VRISVVIPAYNVQRLVGRAIESVLRQKDPDCQIVVVDDGSTDETGAVAAEHDGVVVVRRPNGGLASARNAGISASDGEAVFFLDADDELLPGSLQAIRAAADRIDDWAAIIPNCIRRGPRGRRFAWSVSTRIRVLDRRDVRSLIIRNWLSPHALVRRSVLEDLRYREDLRAVEDLDLWLRMLLAGHKVIVLGSPGVFVREGRPGSLSGDQILMRGSRQAVFRGLWRREDLSTSERFLTGYQIVRTTLGVRLISWDRPTPATTFLQVYLSDGGGGPAHVAVLSEGLRGRVTSRVLAIAPDDVQYLSVGWVRSAMRIAATLRAGTVVHAHGVRAAAVALPGVVVRRCPLVVTVHGLHAIRSGAHRLRLAGWVLRRAERVLVLNESDRQALGAGLVQADRVRLIRAGFRAAGSVSRAPARDRIGLTPGEVAVIWLGRFSAEKDPITFVRAIQSIRDPNVVGVVAGDGPLRASVQSAAAGSRIRMMGWVEDPSAVFAAADICVNTSKWEGLPLAVLEAGAMGLPLILTDVPGNRDLLTAGIPAVTVPPGDPEALAQAIRALCTSASAEIGRRTSKAVREAFSPESLAEDVLAVYREVA
jgi:glycosyltransferase involved in cell wall biosynthesis